MSNTVLFRISSVLWSIWGRVHMLAGVLTVEKVLSGEIALAIGGIADAVDPATLAGDYPAALGAILGQHGFNLLWIGVVTTIGGAFVWKGRRPAVLISALVGGLADVGYFLFMELGGHVKFMPGTLMTLVSASAIILSGIAYYRVRGE